MFKNIVLIPLSWLYALVVRIRHFLFDKHLLVSHTVDVPTICVGNIAVGGTGKTPMVEYLLRLLLAHGYHPAVLSRGYKRKTHGFVMADGNATAQTIGDEPMQVHTAFPDVPVAVCESRVHGAKQLRRQLKDLDVIVLDDAMQHRAIRCGYTILLTAYDNLYIDDHMLPWGRLRDLPSRALKADAVVVTKCPDSIQPIDMRVVDNRLHLPTYQHLHFAGIAYAPLTQPGTPLVVCGIAQPQYLLEHVQAQYPQAELLAFPDHHTFTPQEIAQIVEKAKHFDFVLTTVKDMQRLQSTGLEQQLADQGKLLVTLPIRMRFCTPKEDFDRFILNYVSENNRKHKS
jgi:tetraacyldisaccharide 4'-kinase